MVVITFADAQVIFYTLTPLKHGQVSWAWPDTTAQLALKENLGAQRYILEPFETALFQ